MLTTYIKRFFAFLFPIVRTAALQVAADEITKIAYPSRRPSRNRSYIGVETLPRVNTPNWHRRNAGLGPIAHYEMGQDGTVKDNTGLRPVPDLKAGFHDVLMVAFDLSGNSAEEVHDWLHNNMPMGDQSYDDVFLDSWWVANDERFDGSDCDSAVFVAKGNQAAARKLLREHGLLH